jgi:hypothetical protein
VNESTPVRPTLAGHLAVCRVDHWIKNVFVLPGVVLGHTMNGVFFPPALVGHQLLVRRLLLHGPKALR